MFRLVLVQLVSRIGEDTMAIRLTFEVGKASQILPSASRPDGICDVKFIHPGVVVASKYI